MRSAGIQLHLSSLPSGRLDRDAYEFVDWLAAAGQSWWQILPIGPPGEGDSPYKSTSAFAAWSGFLADPGASVSRREIRDFRRLRSSWADSWADYAGPGATADQVRFDREWSALRRHARERGVRLIGDIPIYVAEHSADHLAHPEIFRTGCVAGAAPDAYSSTGQLWGNPLYDWPALRRQGYGWWTERLRRMAELFDVTRIDHFRGFVAYWSVPADASDASSGHWCRGPGRAPFDAALRELGRLPLIAENLGVITPPVERLRRELGLPGMLVLQFAFDPKEPRSPHRLERHLPDNVMYTGTHDHDTLLGWWRTIDAPIRKEIEEAVLRHCECRAPLNLALIELAFRSPARIAIAQAQDVLGLGSESRMNVPGVPDGNWSWKLERGVLTPQLALSLRSVTESAGRLPA